ncbi:MAG: hypothetical protein R3F65_08515 [bacterium]
MAQREGSSEHHPETPAPAPAPAPLPAALVDRLGRRGLRAALTFAGQGVDALGELAAVLALEPALRPLVAAGADAVAELTRRRDFRWSGLVDRGFDPLAWIADPAAAPATAYLTSTLVSQPLILLAQAARAELTWRRGLAAAARRGAISALTGHSQGIMAAVLLAECPDGIRPDRLAHHARYLAWQGLHMARSTGESIATGEQAPMAAIAGFTHDQLAAHCNRLDAGDGDRPHLTLHNGRTRYVVSGRPATLDRLRAALDAAVAAGKANRRAGRPDATPERHTWEWLAVGGPFHSPLMAAGREAMTRTAADEGPHPTPARSAGRCSTPPTGLASTAPKTSPPRSSRPSSSARCAGPTPSAPSPPTAPPSSSTSAPATASPASPPARRACGLGPPVAAHHRRRRRRALHGRRPPRPPGLLRRLRPPPRDPARRPRRARQPVQPRHHHFAGDPARHDPHHRRRPPSSPPPPTPATPPSSPAADRSPPPSSTAASPSLAEALRLGVAATFNALYLDRYLYGFHSGAEGSRRAASPPPPAPRPALRRHHQRRHPPA